VSFSYLSLEVHNAVTVVLDDALCLPVRELRVLEGCKASLKIGERVLVHERKPCLSRFGGAGVLASLPRSDESAFVTQSNTEGPPQSSTTMKSI
jgi:hypothetical protein